MLTNFNLCVMNNGQPTFVHAATGALSSIDLNIADPTLLLDYSWHVHDDLCGSDHYPIILTNTKPLPPLHVPRWKLHKADRLSFETLCREELESEVEDSGVDSIE